MGVVYRLYDKPGTRFVLRELGEAECLGGILRGCGPGETKEGKMRH